MYDLPSTDFFLLALCLILFLACADNPACPEGNTATASPSATMLACTGHFTSHTLTPSSAARLSFDTQYDEQDTTLSRQHYNASTVWTRVEFCCLTVLPRGRSTRNYCDEAPKVVSSWLLRNIQERYSTWFT